MLKKVGIQGSTMLICHAELNMIETGHCGIVHCLIKTRELDSRVSHLNLSTMQGKNDQI